jgi:hypothetical protein
MHWVQRRRRASLQSRVANGEVDLEALGIKRLTVPQEIIDKLPIYTYSDDPKEVENGHTPDPTSSVAATHPHHTQFSQSTCPICLEDYTSGETTVRELPCRHIFHPECVDSFLARNSSLCPMCKKSVLPKGHCPALVTNAMVRRERLVRLRRQGRITTAANAAESDTPSGSAYLPQTPAQRTAAFGRRVFSAPRRRQTSSQAATQAHDMEMQNQVPTVPAATADTGRPAATVDGQPCPEPAPASAPAPVPVPTDRQGRREWARQRAVSMVGQRERTQDAEVEAIAAQRPIWRRAVGRLFPGFA